MRARELSECVYTRGLFSFNSHHSRIVFYAQKKSFLNSLLFLFSSLSLCCTKMFCSLRIKRSECGGELSEYIWRYYYVSRRRKKKKNVTGMKVNLSETNETYESDINFYKKVATLMTQWNCSQFFKSYLTLNFQILKLSFKKLKTHRNN